MITKQEKHEIELRHKSIQLKKERITKLRRLAKLSKEEDLISELDAIVEQAEKSIFDILDSKSIPDAHVEQVALRGNGRVRLMAKGLKQTLCDSKKQVEILNDEIEESNIRIKEIENRKSTKGANIV